MKKFVAGFLVSVIIMSGTLIFADIIEVILDQWDLVVNGTDLDEKTLFYNDTTYVPIRAVSEALGEEVNYDDATKTAYIGKIPEMSERIASKESKVASYVDFPGVPDFGDYAGIESNYQKVVDGVSFYGYSRKYTKEEIGGYEAWLKAAGFEYARTEDGVVVFSNDKYIVTHLIATEKAYEFDGILIGISEL